MLKDTIPVDQALNEIRAANRGFFPAPRPRRPAPDNAVMALAFRALLLGGTPRAARPS